MEAVTDLVYNLESDVKKKEIKVKPPALPRMGSTQQETALLKVLWLNVGNKNHVCKNFPFQCLIPHFFLYLLRK